MLIDNKRFFIIDLNRIAIFFNLCFKGGIFKGGIKLPDINRNLNLPYI